MLVIAEERKRLKLVQLDQFLSKNILVVGSSPNDSCFELHTCRATYYSDFRMKNVFLKFSLSSAN